MKTLVVISIVVSVALAAPTLQEDEDPRQSWNIQAYPRIPEFVNREKKSPSDLNNTVANKTEISTTTQIPPYYGRSSGSKKPIIVKKKHGYRLYRDSEEEKANTDSHESCGRQVNVKFCDGDGKLREMLRSSGHETTDVHTSEDDMKYSIMMAKEAIENLQRDFKKMEQKSAGDNRDSQSDSDLHEDIEVTRQALEDIHRNFENLETMSLHATALKDSRVAHDFHVRMASAEEERIAMWKKARENLLKNVEVGQNMENEFRATNEYNNKPETACPGNELEAVTHPNLDHMRDAQNIQVQESRGEVTTERLRELHSREDQTDEGDMSPSASETITLKSSFRNDSEDNKQKELLNKLNQLFNTQKYREDTQTEVPQSSPKMSDIFEAIKAQELELNKASPTATELRDKSATQWKSINGDGLLKETNLENLFEEQNESNMKAARPLDHSGFEDLNLRNKHHNIDYNESDNSAALEMRSSQDLSHQNLFDLTKPAEDNWQHTESQAPLSKNLMKSALPSDHRGFQDINLQKKHHNIDYNESEHSASFTEMKAAEDIVNDDEIVAKVVDITGDNLHSEPLNFEAHKDLTSFKTASPSAQIPHEGLQEHHTIDCNESEHTSNLKEGKTAEDSENNILTELKTLEASEGTLLRAIEDNERKGSLSFKTAIPSDILNTQQQDLLRSQFTSLPKMKATEDKHDLEFIQSAPATFSDLKSGEDHSFKTAESNLNEPESKPLKSEWSDKNRHIISMKATQSTDQIDLNEFLPKQIQQNFDQIESENKATLAKMKSTEDQFQDNWSSLSGMRATEDSLDQLEHARTLSLWNTENRPMITMKDAAELEKYRHSQSEHDFIPGEIPHRDDFEESKFGHQHHHHHHRHEPQPFPQRHHHHSDQHDLHGDISSQFHPRLRDAMETLESEHTYQWQPSHESRSSYGGYGGYGAGSIGSLGGSLGGGAVGVFPSANTGGCAIPLLLSCSPSVVSGSLARPHVPSIGLPAFSGGSYSGGSYAGSSFSAPSYRTEDDFSLQAVNKRDTIKTDEIKSTNVLRTPAILKQKTKTIEEIKM